MKKITAILLCAVLMCCILPVTALAAEDYSVYIENEQFTSDNLNIPCGNGQAIYDPDTKTLTLEDAEITADSTAGINVYQKMDLKIVLKGKNVVKGGSSTDQYASGAYRSAGIYLSSSANLEISGDGSLEVSGNVTDGGFEGDGFGIYISSGSLTIKNGTITASGSTFGISADGVTVDGGSLTAISDGTSDGSQDTSYTPSGINMNKLTVNGGSVKGIREINYKEENPNPSYAINGNVVMTGGSLTAEVQDNGEDLQDTAFGIPKNAKAMSSVPDVTGLTGYRWREIHPGEYSEKLPVDYTVGTYFEIMKSEAEKAPVYAPAGEVHQITSAEKPVVSEETNPNTGADYSSILCAGAVLVLAGAAAALKSKKH